MVIAMICKPREYSPLAQGYFNRITWQPSLGMRSHAPSAHKAQAKSFIPRRDPRRVCLSLPPHRPEVGRRGQGIVGVPFSVLVSAIQRPGSVGLAVPDSGHVGLRPAGLVLPIEPLFEQRDGHSIGEVSAAELVLDVPRNPIHEEPVEMGLGGSPDGVWNGYGGLRGSLICIDGTRVGFGGGESQWGLNSDTGARIAPDLNHMVRIFPISGIVAREVARWAIIVNCHPRKAWRGDRETVSNKTL